MELPGLLPAEVTGHRDWTEHARLSAREDEGGEEEAAGGQAGETPAAAARGAGPAGQRTGGAEAEHELEGKKNSGAAQDSQVSPGRAKEAVLWPHEAWDWCIFSSNVAEWQIAEQLLYEHWKKNDPTLREIESDLHKKHVASSWETQKEEKKQQEAVEEEENKRYENEYATARREALGRMKAEEERRQLEDKRQAEALLQQMEELKVQEMEATKLKQERVNLLRQRWELERLAEERKQMAALRQKAELGRFLRHQYNVQLNRRAQQIQEELEADKRILQALLEAEEAAQREHSARREQARADVAWMQQALEQQLQREREQEAELQVLLREEAKEMWEKREAEWARERSARDRLMAEVLTGRQQQIQEKIEQNRRAQEESLRHREQLIQNLEEARESARREKEESEELKSARKQELEAQVAERQRQAWEADQQEAEEEEEARQAEQLTSALLQQEAKMMAKQGYRPKPYGRPRIAWN
ncbi:trichoplein keratin filament-binding protein isoform X3 [Myotis daubentonii]|uniref:trichoplein keratin filament-binding protein isoform X3 n=1 Tax=Myotis daubentonii TaxID=98922 RepID=UPI0028735172|nr:trichoplein keratin filament-binding protein isoform X3 [Myotis daubentonii]